MADERTNDSFSGVQGNHAKSHGDNCSRCEFAYRIRDTSSKEHLVPGTWNIKINQWEKKKKARAYGSDVARDIVVRGSREYPNNVHFSSKLNIKGSRVTLDLLWMCKNVKNHKTTCITRSVTVTSSFTFNLCRLVSLILRILFSWETVKSICKQRRNRGEYHKQQRIALQDD